MNTWVLSKQVFCELHDLADVHIAALASLPLQQPLIFQRTSLSFISTKDTHAVPTSYREIHDPTPKWPFKSNVLAF